MYTKSERGQVFTFWPHQTDRVFIDDEQDARFSTPTPTLYTIC